MTSRYPIGLLLASRPRLQRPRGVKWIAKFQFFKAVILLLAACLLRFRPEDITSTQGFLYPLFYIAMRGNQPALQAVMQGGGLLPGIVGCMGLYVGLLGMGLLEMEPWARRSLLLTSGMAVALFLKTLFVKAALVRAQFAVPVPGLDRFHVLFLVDALMFVYFFRSDIARAFKLHAGVLRA